MGDGFTIRRGDAEQAQPSRSATAAETLTHATRIVIREIAAGRSAAGLSTVRCECPLAFGAPRPFGALGVRSPAQSRRAQGGDLADAWLCQPTGLDVPGPCSTDGRAAPVRAGTIRVPPARTGRLEPVDDWRRDVRGRLSQWSAQTGHANSAARTTRETAGQRRDADTAHGAGCPAPDPVQVALLARISGLHVTAGSTPALHEVAPRSAGTARLACPSAPSRALPRRDVTGTLDHACLGIFGQWVALNGRVGVSDTCGRAERPRGGQKHHHGEPGAPGRSGTRDQSTDGGPAERATAPGLVRRTGEGLGHWRVRRVPPASRRYADPARRWDGWRCASRGDRQASDWRADASVAASQRNQRCAAGRRGLERDSGEHPRVHRGRTAGVPSSSLLQHLEVVTGARPAGPARKSPAWSNTTGRPGAAPLTVRSQDRRMMPVIFVRSVSVSLAGGRSECTGGRA